MSMRTIAVPKLFGKYVRLAGEELGMELNYIFGDAAYIRGQIETNKAAGISANFPLVGLYWTLNQDYEHNPTPDIAARVSLKFIIAVSSERGKGNEERLKEYYQEQLYVIMDAIIESMENDKRVLDFGYNGKASFRHNEGYELPDNGVVDNKNNEFSEIIDAVNVNNLIINIKEINCRNEQDY